MPKVYTEDQKEVIVDKRNLGVKLSRMKRELKSMPKDASKEEIALINEQIVSMTAYDVALGKRIDLF